MIQIQKYRRGKGCVFLFDCPKCGKKLQVGNKEGNHMVSSDFSVSPSVIHECGFHDYITFK